MRAKARHHRRRQVKAKLTAPYVIPAWFFWIAMFFAGWGVARVVHVILEAVTG